MVQLILNFIVCLFCIKWIFNKIDAFSVLKVPREREYPSFRRRKKIKQAQLSKNFYRIYKYIAIQTSSGAYSEEIYKSLYKIVKEKTLKADLMAFSVVLMQRHDLKFSLEVLKQKFDFPEGKMFVDMLESMSGTGLSENAFRRLDQMLFQKYLSEIRAQTDKVKQIYFISVVLFTAVTVGMLLIPLIDQMMFSAKKIFV